LDGCVTVSVLTVNVAGTGSLTVITQKNAKNLCSSAVLCSKRWYFVYRISVQLIGSELKGQAAQGDF